MANEWDGIDFVEAADQRGRPIASISVKETRAQALVDTGASVNILDEPTYQSLCDKPVLMPLKRQYYGFGTKEPLPVMGFCVASVSWRASSMRQPFIIVRGEHRNLIGCETAEALGMISLNLDPDPKSDLDQDQQQVGNQSLAKQAQPRASPGSRGTEDQQWNKTSRGPTTSPPTSARLPAERPSPKPPIEREHSRIRIGEIKPKDPDLSVQLQSQRADRGKPNWKAEPPERRLSNPDRANAISPGRRSKYRPNEHTMKADGQFRLQPAQPQSFFSLRKRGEDIMSLRRPSNKTIRVESPLPLKLYNYAANAQG